MAPNQTPPADTGFGNEKAAMPEPSLPAPVQADAETAKFNRRRKVRRIAHFFIIFSGLWFVFRHFSRGSSDHKKVEFGRHGCGRSAIEFPTLITGASSWSDDGAAAQCVDRPQAWKTEGPFTGHGTHDVYSAQVDFEFTSSSFGNIIEAVGDINLHAPANGNLGNIAFVSASSNETSNLSIDVHVTYSDPVTLKMLRVCDVRAGDQAGVVLGALWSHRRLSADPMFGIGIRVTVPQEGLSSELKTKLPGFLHDVYPGVNLGSLDIVTDRPVHFQSGSAVGDVSVQTANSPITGFFNVSSNLKLVTSNAPIDVDVEAYHTSHHWPSTLRLATSNANLNATLALKNTTQIGIFRVFAQTYNSPVNVTLAESPINGYVRVEAKTKNAPALLGLDSAFEGRFAAHTTNADANIELKEGVEDPIGEGRERFVEKSYVTPRTQGGSVAWGKPLSGHHSSIAAVATTNDPAVIVL
ncbi:unnamed protein product [Peniophora sp. CBMAI 1063]|nr:unnamed protein product [Peniophora sp. CBMAI 1063]